MNAIKNTNIEPFLVGGGRAKLNAEVMMKIKLLVPTIEEQIRIGTFFEKLDKMITKQTELIQSFNQLKKAFLQKMFV